MSTLKITGMTCDSCAVHVKDALEKVPGVQSADVSYAKGSAKLAIEGGTSPAALTAVSKLHHVAGSFDAAALPERGSYGTFRGFPRSASGKSRQHTQFGTAFSSAGIFSYISYSHGSF